MIFLPFLLVEGVLKITVNKTITAGNYGKLASIKEKFTYQNQGEAEQYFAYSDIFDSGSTGGWAYKQFYTGLGHISQPWVSRAILPTTFGLFTFLLLAAFLLSLTKERQESNGYQSRFGISKRLILLSLILMMFWSASCADGGGGSSNPLRPMALAPLELATP